MFIAEAFEHLFRDWRPREKGESRDDLFTGSAPDQVHGAQHVGAGFSDGDCWEGRDFRNTNGPLFEAARKDSGDSFGLLPGLAVEAIGGGA